MDRSEDLWKGQEHRGSGSPAFDRVKAVVADLLVEAADVIHQKSAVTGNAELSNLGGRAANWLEHSADYVREMEAQRLKSDIEDKVRRNPGRSLIIAGVIGLVIGRVIRRR
jgi:ElaB/YqjD/DUF883 family membrane-anchored ribosome-binding protein